MVHNPGGHDCNLGRGPTTQLLTQILPFPSRNMALNLDPPSFLSVGKATNVNGSFPCKHPVFFLPWHWDMSHRVFFFVYLHD